MAGALAVWWWHTGSRVGRRAALGSDPLLSRAALGVAAMAASAPFDELWHRLYGRDAILWSPAHLLAVAATTLVAACLVAAVGRIDTAIGSWLHALTGALLLGALLVPVMEYESDVPQLPVSLYLPVLCVGVLTATGVIRRADRSPWAITRAAIAYSGLRAAIVVVLAALGFSTPIISPVLALAVVIDLVLRWRQSPWWLALGVPVVAHGVYALWLPAIAPGWSSPSTRNWRTPPAGRSRPGSRSQAVARAVMITAGTCIEWWPRRPDQARRLLGSGSG